MIIPHEMIMASAGSGKTYTLGVRLVRLLALGVEPERIVALTFTRKAAAEFLDVVLTRLAKAAENAEAAEILAEECNCPGLSQQRASQLLASVVRSIHRLNLTTIDSFFARIVRSFPYEMGIGGNVDILDPIAERNSRELVMRAIFTLADDDQRRSFLESFKRATFGESKKDLRGELSGFIADFHNLYLSNKDSSFWGDRRQIWQGAFEWDATGDGLEQALDCLLQFVNAAGGTESSAKYLLKPINALKKWQFGQPLPGDFKYFQERFLSYGKDPLPTLKLGKKEYPLTGEQQIAVQRIARIAVSSEITRALERTIGMYELLSTYEKAHGSLIRENGKLTFNDFPLLLRDALADDLIHLDLSFRMDARYDHWLLDEFQDTSRPQWKVLSEFIDEVLQDPEHKGSFFYVGDVKQAIYGWRGGDVSLFKEIFDRYNHASNDFIRRRDLTVSYRCRPAVIDLVNSVFGNSAVIADLFPGKVSDDWNLEWRPHESACNDNQGHAAVFLCEDDAHRYNAAVDLIEAINPIGRNLSCAVLVTKNKHAVQISELLRNRGIPTVLEGTVSPGSDNQIGLLVRALVSAAAHPGDLFSLRYLEMTPLARTLNGEKRMTDRLEEFRITVGHSGFECAIRDVFSSIEAISPLDAFNRQRLDLILAAAREFDSIGRPGYDDFLSSVTNCEVAGNTGSDAIQVMTVHRSKGLGFDCVILPDLERNTLFEIRQPLLIHSRHQGPEWALYRPSQSILSCDPVLAAQHEDNKQTQCYEKLCLLYVAMTRAKYATYAFINEKDSASPNYNTLLKTTLASGGTSILNKPIEAPTLATFGCYNLPTPPGEAAEQATITIDSPQIAAPAALVHAGMITPSGRHGETASLTTALHNNDYSALEIGSRIHRALAAAATESDLSQCLDDLQRSTDTIDVAALTLLTTALASDSVRAIFQCPKTPNLLWREKSFEVLLDNNWISGTFDRVTIHLEDNTPTAADLVDFKSGAQPSPEDHHQIQLYRRALAKILNLPTDKIHTQIVCLGSAKVFDVPHDE